MDETESGLHECMEQLIWDFLDIHGFINSRKSEVTLLAALTILLVGHKKVQMKDIASAFNVSNSTVTDYVDYLESRDYVRRVRSEKDRREVYIQLTDKGQDWIKRSQNITWDYLDERLSLLTADERQQFVTLMCKFMNIAERPGRVEPKKE